MLLWTNPYYNHNNSKHLNNSYMSGIKWCVCMCVCIYKHINLILKTALGNSYNNSSLL